MIPGTLPLEVSFNTCPSSDLDPGDRLKTTYDFDGDGIVDVAGHCRARHRFEFSARPRVCVTDRTPGHEVCRSYEVGRPPSDSTCIPKGIKSLDEAEPNGYDDIGPGPDTPMVLRFGSTRIGGSIKSDGDDYFLMAPNPCDAALRVEARLFGAGGPDDCAADPHSHLALFMEVRTPKYERVMTQFDASACSGPISMLVPPHGSVGIVQMTPVDFPTASRNTKFAPAAYGLEILVTPDR